MITGQNFRKALVAMGFSENDGYFEKEYLAFGCKMQVDFSAKKLMFPDVIKGRERNDGFNKNENFVVFECVNHLLDKGYRPEHIELEKEWHLGHEAKSGRADICVSDADGSMLFIIECKTWGQKFDKAYKDTLSDGGQLFSYWQQEQSCQWLVLYASDYKDGAIEYKAPTIDCSDDANIVLLSKKDKSIKLYRDAHTASEKHIAWKETYASQIHDNLIFSDDSVAYQIGVKPLCKKDLRDFTPEDKIVNKFEEIIRHNNVSDKENAFNRLVALFICKLVDEITKGEDDEVEFQYKQGTDTYETLQDRLQRLHKDGMERFMREEIYYVSADYPERLFSTYTGSKREKAIEDLQKTIRILKFYSNNDFAFKDVHNEELFYQNGKILVEMVQLFEKYRIVYPSKHQFLGDLFEQLLNKGFKQNEGQFFTPIPITRFIWDSLPVDRMVKSDRGTVYPKVIDYACGAGHFLTEAVEAINTFVDNHGDNSWVRDHIFGIEKDYRLARVAKISLFMNGAGEGNIIFGDGLENVPDKMINNSRFDILTANPPYSVKDFKQHLQLRNNQFELLAHISKSGSEIEVLFIERIAQLLKPKGIAAVILPSTILSNDTPTSYVKAREMLLRNFFIRAIVQFENKTFSATPTSTVVLFLEKYNEPPQKGDLIYDSVTAILSGTELKDWKDNEIIGAYLSVIGVSEEEYADFVSKRTSLKDLSSSIYFKMYVEEFLNSSEFKKMQNSAAYKRKNESDQNSDIQNSLYKHIMTVEKEKLFYFALTYTQKTVIISAPTDNEQQKVFLGYDWSNRKGKEGIKILTPGGKLYSDSNRLAEDTLAGIVRNSFCNIYVEPNTDNNQYIRIADTSSCFDFSRAHFNKALRIRAERKIEIHSKYPLKELYKISDLFRGVTYDKESQLFTATNTIVLTADNITLDGRFEVTKKIYVDDSVKFSDDSRLKANDVFICMSSGSKKHIGKVAFIEEDTCYYAGGFMGILRAKPSVCLPKYLYYILNSSVVKRMISDESAGSNINNLSNRIGTLAVPTPPLSIQQKVIDECAIVDEEYNTTRMSIDTYRQRIEEIFNKLGVANRGGQTNPI